MNKLLTTLMAGVFAVALVPANAVANDSYEFGLSDSVINQQRETVTDWLLEQQRATPPKPESELPAQLYIDSQRRLSNTFSSSIPDSLQDKARSTQSTQ